VTRNGDTIGRISEKLKAELETIADYRKQAESISGERAETTGRIRAGIGKAIFALQIGDITRQRVEHVERAIEIIENPSRAPATSGGLAAIYRLQYLQLDQAIAVFEAEVGDLAENINQLAAHATAVLKQASSEAENLRSASGGALGRLAAELRQVTGLIEQFERARVERQTIVDDVTRSVAEMVRHLESIRAIERQIRTLSFNATIQCSRVVDGDQGRGLAAVAQQLRELSNRTVTVVGAIMAGLTSADEETRALVEERDSWHSQQIVAIRDGAAAAIGVFEQLAGRLRTGTESIKSVGARAVSLLGATAQRISDRRGIGASWRPACCKLDQLAMSASEAPDPDAVDQVLRDDLRSAYTMEDERKIHDELFAVASNTTVATVPDEQNLDDLFL
jgi:methyl-accepting chemotaxis protein